LNKKIYTLKIIDDLKSILQNKNTITNIRVS